MTEAEEVRFMHRRHGFRYSTLGFVILSLLVGVALLYLFWRLFMVDVGALRTLLPPLEVR